ncbi:MAG: PAS domain S-box protein [Chitinophagales bacterium]
MLQSTNSFDSLSNTDKNVLFDILYEIALAQGAGFFDAVVESISKNIGSKYVLIGEFLRDSYRVRAKSLWAADGLVKDYEYEILHTPCEHVLSQGIKIFPERVQTLYPKDIDLVKWGIQSYVGIPLFNDKKMCIGHIAVLDTLPLENIDLVTTVLKVCANRVEAELERAINDELIRQREQENRIQTERLAQSLSLLEATIECTADGLLIADGHGKMVRFNQQFVKMWKMPLGLAFGKNEADGLTYVLSQLKDPEQFISKVRELYDNPEAISFDVLYFKDGRIFERYSQPQRIGTKIVGRVWSFRDVTKRIKAETELRRSESLFRSLFEESPIGIVIDDYSGEYLLAHVNKKFSRMLQYSIEELKNMSAMYITHPEDTQKHTESFKDVEHQNSKDSSFEKRYITKDGSIIWANVSLAAVRNELGEARYRVLMIQDITEKKKALLDLKEKAKELDEKNKELQKYIDSNLQLENFAYIASHDLREPLLTIMGLIEVLTESYSEDLNEEALSFLQFIKQSVMNMELLINDLLNYSRVNTQVHTAATFDMDVLLQKIIQGLQQSIDQQNAIIECSDIPQNFTANQTKMIQLFQNLIVNAIKFRNPNVSPIIKISAIDFGTHWQFSVSDNGIGIAPEHNDKIFLLFKKLHSKYEYGGTGIGLATCKKIVEQHGGKIWLESELNKGTTFYFTICKKEN